MTSFSIIPVLPEERYWHFFCCICPFIDASSNNTEVKLEYKEGNINVRNGCIEILIDGDYLLSAQGLKQDKMPGKINFYFEHKTAMGSDDRDIFTQSVLQDTVAVTLIKMLYRDTKVCITSNLVMDQFDVIMYLL